jgi:hypothetical protein
MKESGISILLSQKLLPYRGYNICKKDAKAMRDAARLKVR